MSPAGPPSVREIASLTARLRALSTPGLAADPDERAVFLADKDALLARITDTTNCAAPPGAGDATHQGATVTGPAGGVASPGRPAGLRVRRELGRTSTYLRGGLES
jgi:hypothetical protein